MLNKGWDTAGTTTSAAPCCQVSDSHESTFFPERFDAHSALLAELKVEQKILPPTPPGRSFGTEIFFC